MRCICVIVQYSFRLSCHVCIIVTKKDISGSLLSITGKGISSVVSSYCWQYRAVCSNSRVLTVVKTTWQHVVRSWCGVPNFVFHKSCNKGTDAYCHLSCPWVIPGFIYPLSGVAGGFTVMLSSNHAVAFDFLHSISSNCHGSVAMFCSPLFLWCWN